MSAIDAAKDAIRIVSTAGLSKDIIDLLEKKLSLLTEEIKLLNSKISHLETENANLKAQLQHLQPASSLSKETSGVLRFFFDAGRDLSVDDIVSAFSLELGVVNYHFDILLKNKLIIPTRAAVESSWTGENNPDMYALTALGRKYIVENKTS